MDLNLQGKRVLITGSTQGIGKSVAELFLKEGAKVIINGRNEDKMKLVLKELKKKYSDENVFGVCGNILEEKVLEKLKQEVKFNFQGLDILISNVGTGKSESKDLLLVNEWERLMQINLFSTVRLLHEFLPILKIGNKPSIVLISSIAAKECIGAPYAYAAAKSSILTLTHYLSRDISKDDIRINSVLPGNVLFSGGRWETLLKARQNEVLEMISQNVPLNRFACPEEIADAVVFLASERASFITGTSLAVDGGQLNGI